LLTSEIKNIIFDLGGVIINLAVHETHKAFSNLSGISVEQIKNKVHNNEFFHLYEKGLISDSEFRELIRRELSLENKSDEVLDAAWNAMLLDIPIQRVQLLERLKGIYRLYVLSNTNNIHLRCFNDKVKDLTGRDSLDEYFDNAYYSHLINLSKPDTAIYEYVIDKNNLQAEETIFLDDNLDNLAGADKVGIKTFHVKEPDQIFSLFK
jgi:putative hydrolase of the HAD superfamily